MTNPLWTAPWRIAYAISTTLAAGAVYFGLLALHWEIAPLAVALGFFVTYFIARVVERAIHETVMAPARLDVLPASTLHRAIAFHHHQVALIRRSLGGHDPADD